MRDVALFWPSSGFRPTGRRQRDGYASHCAFKPNKASWASVREGKRPPRIPPRYAEEFGGYAREAAPLTTRDARHPGSDPAPERPHDGHATIRIAMPAAGHEAIAIGANGRAGRAVYLHFAVGAAVLFLLSSLKYALFLSTSHDLGFFDQAVYLISRLHTPVVSFSGSHVLGDHAAVILYAMAPLYRIWADVHWLLAVQAVALAVGVFPVHYLARDAGLDESDSLTLAVIYLASPFLFNANLFDFHPEVIAVPALLGAVLAARRGNLLTFAALVVVSLACKEIIGLTVLALGLWLFVGERRRAAGAVAAMLGFGWFLVATFWVIPHFAGHQASGLDRYSYLGHDIRSMAANVVANPWLLGSRLFSLDTLWYLVRIAFPVAWALRWGCFAPLTGAIPAVLLNVVAGYGGQRSLEFQYTLPILPFLILTAIQSRSSGRSWLRSRRALLLWAGVSFLLLANFHAPVSRAFAALPTAGAMAEAVRLVDGPGGVLTTAEAAPHLTHRDTVVDTDSSAPPTGLDAFDYVLLNVPRPGWRSDATFAALLVKRVMEDRAFALRYSQDGVFLFARKKPWRGIQTSAS